MITDGFPETKARTLSDFSEINVIRLCTANSAITGKMPYKSGVETDSIGVEIRSASKMAIANS